MRIIPRFPLLAAVAVMTVTAAVECAHAANPYDGAWHVQITTVRGTCGSGSGFGLQIRDGAVYGYGGYDVSGRVSPNGAVTVRVSSGSQSASGSGRLRGNAGRGSWRGAGSQGACSGYWTASRG
jgi:hypothetical protein